MMTLSIPGTIESREVAEMTGKRHDHLMRDIETYMKYLDESNAPNFGAVDFFIESAYQEVKGEVRKCYLVTRKGCEMIANKLTGAKGVLFTAAYITRFHELEQIQATPVSGDDAKLLRAQAMLMNAQVRTYKVIMQTIADKTKLAPIAVEVFGLKALEKITGVDVGNYLPACERTCSASDIAKMYGVTSAKIGRLANEHGLKTPEFGRYVLDKSRYSTKEVETFRYNERGVERIGEILDMRNPSGKMVEGG